MTRPFQYVVGTNWAGRFCTLISNHFNRTARRSKNVCRGTQTFSDTICVLALQSTKS